MTFYESVSGARMHAAYYRPVSTKAILPTNLLGSILGFAAGCQKTLNNISGALTENRIWKKRLLNTGAYSFREVKNYGLTGVMARCTGLKRDVRFNKQLSYGNYIFTGGKSYVTYNGDSLDRYLLRLQEMHESLLIVTRLAASDRRCSGPNKYLPWFGFVKLEKSPTSMEGTIKHFKKWSLGNSVQKGLTTQFVESPKGEFGVTLISNDTNMPYRCKIRSPAYNHIQFLPKLIKNKQLADLITIIGTIDIVFGEIDR
jgi:NADH-quinone oxidoreductase subunit D